MYCSLPRKQETVHSTQTPVSLLVLDICNCFTTDHGICTNHGTPAMPEVYPPGRAAILRGLSFAVGTSPEVAAPEIP